MIFYFIICFGNLPAYFLTSFAYYQSFASFELIIDLLFIYLSLFRGLKWVNYFMLFVSDQQFYPQIRLVLSYHWLFVVILMLNFFMNLTTYAIIIEISINSFFQLSPCLITFFIQCPPTWQLTWRAQSFFIFTWHRWLRLHQ